MCDPSLHGHAVIEYILSIPNQGNMRFAQEKSPLGIIRGVQSFDTKIGP